MYIGFKRSLSDVFVLTAPRGCVRKPPVPWGCAGETDLPLLFRHSQAALKMTNEPIIAGNGLVGGGGGAGVVIPSS